MATIDVTTSRNLSAVPYATRDLINVGDGATLTIDSQWATKPQLIQALGTGRIEVSNASTTAMMLLEFDMQDASNSGGFLTQQNAVGQVRGDWITVGTSTGANNQILFNCNSVGGKAIDYPTMIEVETSSGTGEYESWLAVPEDVAGGTVNTLGFNAPNLTIGTVAVAANGVVTGTNTAFTTAHVGLPFKLPGIARDFVVGVFTSGTLITIQEANGTTYTGGVVAAGSSYILRSGSLISPAQVGSGDLGKVLFFNPLTGAVRMGDGVNGTKIPTGARIRIPNIHINSGLQQTTLATAITGTAAQAFTLASPIGPLTNAGVNVNQAIGTLLLINGSTIERIYYATRGGGGVVSATGQLRGQAGTTAATFPVGTLVYWIPGSVNTTNNAGFSCNPSGTFDLQVCSVGLRFRNEFSNYASLTLKKFGCQTLLAGNGAGTYDLDGFDVLGMSYQVPSAIASSVNFSSMLGVGSIRNGDHSNNIPAGASSNAFALANVQNAQFISNLKTRLWGRSASSAAFRAFSFTAVKCATPIRGIYMAGGGLLTASSTDININEIFWSSLPNANTNSSADVLIPITNTGLVDSTLWGFQIWNGGLATRGVLISTDTASERVVCHNKGYAPIEGSLQIPSIVLDTGLNSITAHISVTNPRVQNVQQSYLSGSVTTNSGGALRMLLIDAVTATVAGTGGASKNGVEIDVVAGPHRAFQVATTAAIIANLIDVQPIVVLSNTAKTISSVYVGPFSAQSAFNMYAFTGGAYLDNLGRIYYPAIGDSVIIKSVFPLRGISTFTGTAFDFNFNLGGGSNPIPTGTTLEFRMVNWGMPNTGAWTAFTNNANLETARAALTDYSSSVGIDLQLRITGTTAVSGRYVMGIKFPAALDASYNPPVGFTDIGVTGAQTDTIIAGYLSADPNNPILQGGLKLGGSFGSIPMPYDYDNVPVDYRLVARLQGWTFSDITGIYGKNDISIPITQSPVRGVTGNFLYTSGVTGVAVNHDASTITLSANRSAVQLWSAVQDNLCALANLTQADPFSTTNGLSFVSAYTLVVSGALTSGNVVGNVTLTGSLSSGVSITGNVAQAIPTNLGGVTINGDLTFNTNAPITVMLTDCTISGTIRNNGTATVTITKVNTTLGIVGARVTAQQFATISAPNLLTGSRVRVYDEDNDAEMFNGVLGSAGFEQSFVYTSDKTVTLTATYTNGNTAKLGLSATGIFTAGGLTFLNMQADDTVYNAYGINGSAVTGFTADYVQDDVNLTMMGSFYGADLYAWSVYNTTRTQGIREFFGGITALDVGNIRINADIVNLVLDNDTAAFINQMDTIRIYRSDGAYPARTVTSGGGGIDVCWSSNVFTGTLDSLAATVWGADTADHTVPGSMGSRILTVPKFLALK